jgi:hypothetical protein
MQKVVAAAYTVKDVASVIEKWMNSREGDIPETFNVKVERGIDWFDVIITWEV